MVHPTPNGLVGHRHSALRQQILDVTQAEGEPEVEPYCLVNDLGRETIPGVADLVHPRGATRPPRTPQAQSAVTMPYGRIDVWLNNAGYGAFGPVEAGMREQIQRQFGTNSERSALGSR